MALLSLGCAEVCKQTRDHSENEGSASYRYVSGLSSTASLQRLQVLLDPAAERVSLRVHGEFVDALGDRLESELTIRSLELDRTGEVSFPTNDAFLCFGSGLDESLEARPLPRCERPGPDSTLSIEAVSHSCEEYKEREVCRTWFKGKIFASWNRDGSAGSIQLDLNEGGDWHEVECLD